jgi:hypothetical protein
MDMQSENANRESKSGEQPLAVKIASGFLFVSLLVGFVLLVWRDYFAPTSPGPGYECISRGKHTTYFVPCWVSHAIISAVLVSAAAFIVIFLVGRYSRESHTDSNRAYPQ